MKTVYRYFIFFILIIKLISCSNENSKTKVVAIQPLGKVGQKHLDSISYSIEKYYEVRVVQLPAIAIPERFKVVLKTPRYRADSLLSYLNSSKADSIDYILGITQQDISVTVRENGKVKEPYAKYIDWGVFGYGYKPGAACVVSAFRLNSNHPKIYERLRKVCLHELGHNFGLDHCSNKNCFMTDAAEKLSTIDLEGEELCGKCKEEVGW